MKIDPMLAGWLTFAGIVIGFGPGPIQALVGAVAGILVGRQLAKERDGGR